MPQSRTVQIGPKYTIKKAKPITFSSASVWFYSTTEEWCMGSWFARQLEGCKLKIYFSLSLIYWFWLEHYKRSHNFKTASWIIHSGETQYDMGHVWWKFKVKFVKINQLHHELAFTHWQKFMCSSIKVLFH